MPESLPLSTRAEEPGSGGGETLTVGEGGRRHVALPGAFLRFLGVAGVLGASRLIVVYGRWWWVRRLAT